MAEDEEEGKTLFEHLGLTGNKKEGSISKSYEKFKKMIISLMVYMVIGYILGMILDIFLNQGIYAVVLSLCMALIWIIAVFKKYLKIGGK